VQQLRVISEIGAEIHNLLQEIQKQQEFYAEPNKSAVTVNPEQSLDTPRDRDGPAYRAEIPSQSLQCSTFVDTLESDTDHLKCD
jgi:hypothetical protein